MALTIIAIILILFVVITVHELGHFLSAKASGVRVDEFGIGFPPRFFAFKRGETEYSLNLIPIGAFVKMPGKEDTSPRSLSSKSPWLRFGISSAGPVANILLALVLFSIAFMIPTQVITGGEGIKVIEVAPNSPAAEAGILKGDIILNIDGESVETFDDMSRIVKGKLGTGIEMTLQRDEKELTTRLVPRPNPPRGEGAVGVGLSWATVHTAMQSYPFWQAVSKGAALVIDTPRMLIDFIPMAIQSPDKALIGPIGAAQATGEVMKYGIASVIGLAGSISIGLAIFNFIPIPPLDGAGMALAILEGIRRGKRLSPRSEQLAYVIGTTFLIMLTVLIWYNDILRLISGERILP